MPALETAFSARGARRLSLAMLEARSRADGFAGLAPGSAKPLRLLAAFQEAEPYLGLPPQAFKLLAWLVKMTRPGDWEVGSRPIAWPSAARQQEFLGLAPSAIKILNRTLAQAGVFVLRDSPTGKRYGRRDAEGRIVEAYGFDLSPLAFRFDEFLHCAAEARVARARAQALRRRVTCARRAIAQVLQGLAPALAAGLAAEAAALAPAPRSAPERLLTLAAELEALQGRAEALWKTHEPASPRGPEGPVERPHIIATNSDSHPSDTVPAIETHSRPPAPQETAAQTHPSELMRLAPRLAAHLAAPYADWGDLINAAGGGLARELGVSPQLWGEACLALGRCGATLALAIVSTKPPEHFTRGAGGYFAAMVKRRKSGELRLERSLWRLRREALGRP